MMRASLPVFLFFTAASVVALTGCASSDHFPTFDRTPIELSNSVSGQLIEDRGCIKLAHGGRKSVLAWMQGTKSTSYNGQRYVTDHQNVKKAIGDQVTLVGGESEISNFSGNSALTNYLIQCGGDILTVYRFSENDGG